MSIAASAWAWQQDIPTGPKFVLVDLADRHNGQTGKCVAKVATIAARTGQCARSVQRHIGDLVLLGLIALQSRHKRAHRFILRLPEAAAAKTRQEPAVASPPPPAREPAPIRDTVSPIAPGLATQCHPEPEEVSRTGREEERASAAPPPAPVPPLVEILPPQKEASRIEAPVAPPTRPPGRSARQPLPDDWSPSREERQLAIDAGFSPSELVEEMADWARANLARSADWGATFRNWIKREGKLYRRRDTRKRDRQQEKEAWLARSLVELHAADVWDGAVA